MMKKKARSPKFIIGWREIVSMPDLGLIDIPAKIDTGARTTALHADHIRRIQVKGEDWVEFHPSHPALDDVDLIAQPLRDMREITNTSGVPEERFVIATPLVVGERVRSAEISLTDRAGMNFPIIIGRRALRTHRMIVDISKSWTTDPERRNNRLKSKDEEE